MCIFKSFAIQKGRSKQIPGVILIPLLALDVIEVSTILFILTQIKKKRENTLGSLLRNFKSGRNQGSMVSLEERSYVTEYEEGNGTAWRHPRCVPVLVLYM